MNCMNEGQSAPVSILYIALHGCLFLCTRLLVWLGKIYIMFDGWFVFSVYSIKRCTMITIYKRVAALKRESSAPFVNLVQGEHSSRERISLPWVCLCVSVCGCLRMEGPVWRFFASTQVCMHTRACWRVCPLFACTLAAAARHASRSVNVEVWVYYRLGWAEPTLSGLSISAAH